MADVWDSLGDQGRLFWVILESFEVNKEINQHCSQQQKERSCGLQVFVHDEQCLNSKAGPQGILDKRRKKHRSSRFLTNGDQCRW